MTTLTLALSTALVDFVWQGACVGLLLWLALVVLRHRSANARYAVSCIALFVLAALPFFTVGALWRVASAAPVLPSKSLASPPIAAMPQTLLQVWMVPDAPPIAWLQQLQEWVLPIWSVGVLCCSIRLMSAWMHAVALVRGAAASDDSVISVVNGLASRIGITRRVRVLVSSLAEGPGVIGWLRPVILLPPAAAMGLTPTQLDAVLAHELAHIKRHDYLINMLQVVVETLFFYQPAVWWISRQMRLEREWCCDDIAVRSCGDAIGYARALSTLARRQLTPAVTIPATGGSLKYRVQRLLGLMPREFEPARVPSLIVLSVAIAAVILSVDRLNGQVPQSSAQPRFEVASVKVNKTNNGISSDQNAGGTSTFVGYPLRRLIQAAYQVQEFQIAGGPNWMDVERFDIIAKAPRDAPPTAPDGVGPTGEQLMLRSLLTDRFTLSVHKETRQLPVYALVFARTDHRLGPNMHRLPGDCDAARGGPGCRRAMGPGVIHVRGDMARLTSAFAGLTLTGSSLNRLVIDRTGLQGFFDVELLFTPDLSHLPDVALSFLKDARAASGAPPIDPNGPSIFTAVQEQLGLKLDPQRGPVEVLVIDRVTMPTEN
jgi:uncharacterized protein (TIGR03435 family)